MHANKSEYVNATSLTPSPAAQTCQILIHPSRSFVQIKLKWQENTIIWDLNHPMYFNGHQMRAYKYYQVGPIF